MNKIAKEAELSRNVRVVLNRPYGHFQGSEIATAISIINEVANRILKLRKNSKGESEVRGTGEVLGNTMILNLTIPLDTRYAQDANAFNNGWADVLRRRLRVQSGGYVESESTPHVEPTRVTIETTGSIEELQNLLGGFGRIVN